MDKLDKFRHEFIENSCYRMDESLRMIGISLENITEEQLWQKPNHSLNSIGNLILHLCGNMTQYAITSLRGTDDMRERDIEFSTRGGFSKEELLKKLKNTVAEVKATLHTCATDRFLTVKSVQGFRFSGIGNAIHVVEHFSYHTGQIAFWVKLLNDRQLGFYDGHNLNMLNENGSEQ